MGTILNLSSVTCEFALDLEAVSASSSLAGFRCFRSSSKK